MLEMNGWPCLVGRVVIPQGHRVVVLLGLRGGSVTGGKCAIIFRVFTRRSLDEGDHRIDLLPPVAYGGLEVPSGSR